MLDRSRLRESIATEAARLLLRRKESNYAAARIRASRWFSRRRVSRDEMPSRAEIEEQLYVLSGLESAEHQAARLAEFRRAGLAIGERLADGGPRFAGAVVSGPVAPGDDLVVWVTGEAEAIAARLREHAAASQVEVTGSTVRLRWERHPCLVLVAEHDPDAEEVAAATVDTIDLVGLRSLVAPRPHAGGAHDGGAHAPGPDNLWPADEGGVLDPEFVFDALHLLLARLEGVSLDPVRHPEGDALYHALQVFELGRAERPWDEEFLLACLLHDVGLAIEPRHRVDAALEALDGLVDERTLALIEELPRMTAALAAGTIPRSLRRSERYDDLLLLARCDREGRQAGATVCTLDEALEYIAGLDGMWDDPG